jgi:hypothetical protein
MPIYLGHYAFVDEHVQDLLGADVMTSILTSS